MSGLFELRKDITVPGRYYRAGCRKTKKEWEALFLGMAPWDLRQWFIDLDAMPEAPRDTPAPAPVATDPIRAVVNDVFEKAGLRSLSYKDAAVAAIEEYQKRLRNG